MPCKIKKLGKGKYVLKSGNKTIGKHRSKKAAGVQRRAIYASKSRRRK